MHSDALKNKEGSALMIALILMGILMALALGVANLLLDGMRSQRGLVERSQARYAAESGLEAALFAVRNNPAGFEAAEKRELGDRVSYEYRITAAASEIPGDGEYADLKLNESITIPLFRAAGSASDGVKKFRTDFYLAPELAKTGAMVDEDLEILRWKIFGIAPDGATEVLSEFVPMKSGQTAAENPSCLGTHAECWNVAKFYERGPEGFTIIERHPIEAFLATHTQNFLVLTNVVNIDMIQADTLSREDKMRIANIKYRILEGDGVKRLTMPKIHIEADGFAGPSGETKQSLNVELARESFLPMLNYALYRTAD